MKNIAIIFLICLKSMLMASEFYDISIKKGRFGYNINYFNIPPNNISLFYYIFINDSTLGSSISFGTDYCKTLFLNSGIHYGFRSFSSHIFYTSNIPFSFNHQYIEHIGSLNLGYNFNYFKLENNFKIGLMNHSPKLPDAQLKPYKFINTLTLINTVLFLLPLYYSETQRAETNISFSYKYIPEYQDNIYKIHWTAKYLVSIPYSEIGLKSDIIHSGYLGGNTNFKIGNDYNAINLYSLAFFPKNISTRFNTILNLEVEYRLFFLQHLENIASDLFLSASSNIGHGIMEVPLSKSQLLYIINFGIGYKFNREIPFTLRIGFNQNMQLLIGFFSSPITFSN
ncbi:hypothetical protein CR532_04855 (plasmid) [Candidatus Borreliella tachyglossi]|uniref:Uncharacterized protein n=1 Tax=Candidatus Borreliella tachyglossi TaxID=1964448 RepID=A0A2S1LYG3_9SPIR|nr:hypothetical protein [Candidatus Borreliella tachyglossi]AWG43329.1 hypothetical protein CR532_04855 [Candidatus Borreliella tachyglossi]